MKQKIENMRQILDAIETERFRLHMYQTIKEAFPSYKTDLTKRSSDEIERLQKSFNDEVRFLQAIELYIKDSIDVYVDGRRYTCIVERYDDGGWDIEQVLDMHDVDILPIVNIKMFHDLIKKEWKQRLQL